MTALAIGGLAVGVAGLLMGSLSYVRAGRVRKECAEWVRDAGVVPEGAIDPHAIRHVSMLRYDAFRDMGGRLSFSLALLDTTGDGVVITSINAHSETRTYAKTIDGGESVHDLSPEERQALAQAGSGRTDRTMPGNLTGQGGRGTHNGQATRAAT